MTPELVFFIALLGLCIVLLLIKLSNLNKTVFSAKKAPARLSVPVPVVTTNEKLNEDFELVAVISAAIAEHRKTRQAQDLSGRTLPPHGFIIRRIRQIS